MADRNSPLHTAGFRQAVLVGAVLVGTVVAMAGCSSSATSGSTTTTAADRSTTTTSTAGSAGTSGTHTAEDTGAAVNVAVTDQVRSQLVAAGAAVNGIPVAQYSGLAPGLTYEALDRATGTYWAGARLAPAPTSDPSNPTRAQVASQDDGSYYVFQRPSGGSWTAYARGGQRPPDPVPGHRSGRGGGGVGLAGRELPPSGRLIRGTRRATGRRRRCNVHGAGWFGTDDRSQRWDRGTEMDVRRVVTGHDAHGKAVFVADERGGARHPVAGAGHGVPPAVGRGRSSGVPRRRVTARGARYFPPVGGFRFGLFTIPPDGGAGVPRGPRHRGGPGRVRREAAGHGRAPRSRQPRYAHHCHRRLRRRAVGPTPCWSSTTGPRSPCTRATPTSRTAPATDGPTPAMPRRSSPSPWWAPTIPGCVDTSVRPVAGARRPRPGPGHDRGRPLRKSAAVVLWTAVIGALVAVVAVGVSAVRSPGPRARPSPVPTHPPSVWSPLIGAYYSDWFPTNSAQGTLRQHLVPAQGADPDHRRLGRPPGGRAGHRPGHPRAGSTSSHSTGGPRRPAQNKNVDAFLKARNLADIKFCMLYETWDLGFDPGNESTPVTPSMEVAFDLDLLLVRPRLLRQSQLSAHRRAPGGRAVPEPDIDR